MSNEKEKIMNDFVEFGHKLYTQGYSNWQIMKWHISCVLTLASVMRLPADEFDRVLDDIKTNYRENHQEVEDKALQTRKQRETNV